MPLGVGRETSRIHERYDCAGNVYLSGGSIRDPAGAEIAKFTGGTNLAFGGPDGKTLLVVGGGTGVKVIPMNVPGLP